MELLVRWCAGPAPGVVVFFVLLGAACNRTPSRPEPPPAPRPTATGSAGAAASARLLAEIAKLEAEAGLRGLADSPPPSGDLRGEIDSFAGLDACVKERSLGDPLLGDVIEALGYDTLVLDACRMLEALKTKDPDLCKSIALSAFRFRCETSAAVLAGNPALCPIAAAAGRSASRDPTCLARATRDERLCAAAIPPDRPTCAAMVLADPRKCTGDALCVRQVTRWRALIEKPAEHRPFPAQGRVELHGLDKTPDPPAVSFDLSAVARQGAALRRGAGGRTTVVLGSAPMPSAGRADGPAEPRLSLELVLHEADLGKGERPLGPGQIMMDLRLPKFADRSFGTVTDAKLLGCTLVPKTGSPVKLALTATLTDTPNKYAVKVEIETFVRDVIGGKERSAGLE
jgi:hypothetical protein